MTDIFFGDLSGPKKCAVYVPRRSLVEVIKNVWGFFIIPSLLTQNNLGRAKCYRLIIITREPWRGCGKDITIRAIGRCGWSFALRSGWSGGLLLLLLLLFVLSVIYSSSTFVGRGQICWCHIYRTALFIHPYVLLSNNDELWELLADSEHCIPRSFQFYHFH